ncbi:hypothetical protein GCM10023191_060110 [Actinoallomurus oryzae]|uniref:Uncharacterized protein n=1 Tax=Actinoallomurus oryzae TaxID=502180 RepID=A0ABP8QME3_9ACTN
MWLVTPWLNRRAVRRWERLHMRAVSTLRWEEQGRWAEVADELASIITGYGRLRRLPDVVDSLISARIRRCNALIRAGGVRQALAEADQLTTMLRPDSASLRRLRETVVAAARDARDDTAERLVAEWSAAACPSDGFRLARAVDVPQDASGRAVPAGPGLETEERAALVRYLTEAPLVAVAWGYDPDPFDPDRPEVVPLNLHTDGTWVWSEGLAYFADRYGIAPEPDLLAAIRQRGYRPPEVDEATVHRAAAWVRER